jgi:hypothetical protein
MQIPTAGEVVGEVSTVLLTICNSLLDAARWTQDFYKRAGEHKPDRSLSPNLMRYFALRYLDNAGHALLGLASDYEREEISNNGIMVSWQRYQVRVRKAVDGFVLPPPASDALDSYYSQEQLSLALPETPSDPPDIRLMLLWDVDLDYSITSFTLALPRTGGADPDVYWLVPLAIEQLTKIEETNDLELTLKGTANEKKASNFEK